MGLLSTCCRVFVVVCNIFFVILGLIFFGAGLFIRFGNSVYDSYIDGAKDAIQQSASASGLGTVDLSNFQLSDILLGLALAFIFFGLFILAISFLGCCGACYKIQVLLIVYVIICGVLLIGQAIVIGLVYGDPDTIKNPTKNSLKDSIKSDYQGLNGTNTVSIAWNVIMQKVECCGVDAYTDFTGATGWVTNYAGYTLVTPLACCKTLPSSNDYTCATGGGATESNNYLNKGCFDKIWDATINKAPLAYLVIGGIGLFQVLLIVFGLVLVSQWKSNKTSPDDNKQRPLSVDRVAPLPPAVKRKREKKLNF